MSLKHDFPKLLEAEPAYHDKALKLAEKVFNYSELAAKKIGNGDRGLGTGERTETVTYHDACHLRRGCGVHEEPRQVLRELAGVEIKEMTDCDKCCGFGGSYSFKFPEISAEVLKNKKENIRAAGVTTVAVDCPGCKMQIEGGLEADGSSIRVEHSATLVARKMNKKTGQVRGQG